MVEIRKAAPQDLPELLAIFERARALMRAAGNPDQWGTSRPSEQTLRADIAAGNSFVATENGAIAATFCFFVGEEPTYRTIEDGAWQNDRPYGVIHRIASAGVTRGAAGSCIKWCLARCGTLRIDTHRDNASMRQLLQKHGFSYCGVIHLADGAARLAFQKINSQELESE